MASASAASGSSGHKQQVETRLAQFQAASHAGEPAVMGPLADELELTQPPLAAAVVARAQTAQILCAICNNTIPEARFTHERATTATRDRKEFASAYQAARALRRNDTAACLQALTSQSWPEQLQALARNTIGIVRGRAIAYIARSFETIELDEALRILRLAKDSFDEICCKPFGWVLQPPKDGKVWVTIPAPSARQVEASMPIPAGAGAALDGAKEIDHLAKGAGALERSSIVAGAEAAKKEDEDAASGKKGAGSSESKEGSS